MMPAALALATCLAASGCAIPSSGSDASPSVSVRDSTDPAAGQAAAITLGEKWREKVTSAQKEPADYRALNNSDYSLMIDSFSALPRADLDAMCPAVRSGADTYASYVQGAGSMALPAASYNSLVTNVCTATQPDESTELWLTLK